MSHDYTKEQVDEIAKSFERDCKCGICGSFYKVPLIIAPKTPNMCPDCIKKEDTND